MPANDVVIAQTKKWITEVVVQCGFCPFAAQEVKRDSIRFTVIRTIPKQGKWDFLTAALKELDHDKSIETTLLIFPTALKDFHHYLDVLSEAEDILERTGYEGVYQLASFHPQYLFEGADEDDAANYTNRSPYPMLHLLREESVTRAIESHPDIDGVPARNIRYARKKGLNQMKLLLKSCF